MNPTPPSAEQIEKAAQAIEHLLAYGLEKELISELDIDYVRNQLLDTLKIEQPTTRPVAEPRPSLPAVLDVLLQHAVEAHLIEDTGAQRDLFDTRIMGFLTVRPSEVARRFEDLRQRVGIEEATSWFYTFCRDCNYIRSDRIAKNESWETDTRYGRLQITINLAKPEKDPRDIAALKDAQSIGYPKCLLCKENVGFAGRIDHPARQNLRVIPLKLEGEQWYFQYSPYVYYNEHCIVLSKEHRNMRIDEATFRRLLAFLEQFPHYFIGSNADLPIVGGSILNHDHFQGGRHRFPMDAAPAHFALQHDDFPAVEAAVLKWPLSTIRLSSTDPSQLVKAATHTLRCWRGYSDPKAQILARSTGPDGEEQHNTITPIARRRGQKLELDLVLRNNRTSDDHPLGIFHPHADLHHIKKENIGLIEVMGLAILPGRLKRELAAIADILAGKEESSSEVSEEDLAKHENWIEELRDLLKEGDHGSTAGSTGDSKTTGSAEEAQMARIWALIRRSVGDKFARVLEDAGVYKQNETGLAAFRRFCEKAGYEVVE